MPNPIHSFQVLCLVALSVIQSAQIPHWIAQTSEIPLLNSQSRKGRVIVAHPAIQPNQGESSASSHSFIKDCVAKPAMASRPSRTRLYPTAAPKIAVNG